MASHGNDAARDAYESKVPPFYYRPTSSDCQLLREQWIRAKYERLEFTHPEKQEPYSAGKSARRERVSLAEKLLDPPDARQPGWTGPRCTGSVASVASWPKTSRPAGKTEKLVAPSGIVGLWGLGGAAENGVVRSAVWSPGVEWALGSRQLHRRGKEPPRARGRVSSGPGAGRLRRRHSDPGPAQGCHAPQQASPSTQSGGRSSRPRPTPASDPQEIVDWFNALRAARFHYLQVAFPGASDADLVPKLSRNYLKEGYMEKTGPKQTEGFRKRWFTMDDRRLMYFKDPLDAFARGEVFIGSRESGYTVLDGLPPSTQGHHWPHGITIVTPERRFLLACETESEQRAWMEAFRKVVDRPMLPQEYAVEAHFKHKP
ncbi:arf-GAP with dual PH domain-containing protein 1 [Herpailurus yagouaroundi]|uniref:arf-GAP with dual PH domain-containing protein 1 n=1 Tax=Herpailurus yagouaroundi TaxID=1608482 RepID=UPI001AD7A19F|nr:arf-GAP with dual PH domain-containing protein 1 [Puma yagouaroundi]